MAEHVVKDVRLLQIVELVGPADELAGREPAVGQVLEEHIVRYEARHGHHRPAGQSLQLLVDAAEFRDPGPMHIQSIQTLRNGSHARPGSRARWRS